MIRLHTKRLIIRDPLLSDIDGWHRLLSDRETMYYLPDIMTMTYEESRENLDVAVLDAQNAGRTRYFFTIENNKTGAFIGTVGYTVKNTTCRASLLMLGILYCLNAMAKALSEVIRFAFEDDGVYRLSTGCLSENEGEAVRSSSDLVLFHFLKQNR